MTRSAQLKLAQKPLLDESNQTKDAKQPGQQKTLEMPSEGEIQKHKEDKQAEIEREKEVAEGKFREEEIGIDAGKIYMGVMKEAKWRFGGEPPAEVEFKLKTWCKEEV